MGVFSKKFNTTLLLSLLFLTVNITLTSCDDNEIIDPVPEFPVPTTYEFERNGTTTVSYSGQTERLDMLAEMDAYMQGTRTLGATVDAATLKAMYANEGNPFSATYGKNLKSKTFQADTDFFEQWMDDMATASALNQNASSGQAGHLNEEFPAAGSEASAGYLVNENGIEYQQVISKGLMGAVFYYQASEVYFGQERMGLLGNDELAEGKNYTNMEHYFDEGFGYFGIATDFSNADVEASAERARFWGKYCVARHTDESGRFGYNGINGEIMDAFLIGRTAVVAKDYEARDEVVTTVLHTWEKIIGSTAADYLERSLSSNNPATYKKHHYLSEAIGFMLALKYHFDGGNSTVTRLSDTNKIAEAMNIIGVNTNLYELTDADINTAIDLIIAAFPDGTIR